MRDYIKAHKAAGWVILVALLTDAICGVMFSIAQHLPLWHGEYVALANAVTFGGDVVPNSTLGYITNTIECLIVIPLFGATLSLFTSSVTGEHVKGHVYNAHEAMKDHLADPNQPIEPGEEFWRRLDKMIERHAK